MNLRISIERSRIVCEGKNARKWQSSKTDAEWQTRHSSARCIAARLKVLSRGICMYMLRIRKIDPLWNKSLIKTRRSLAGPSVLKASSVCRFAWRTSHTKVRKCGNSVAFNSLEETCANLEAGELPPPLLPFSHLLSYFPDPSRESRATSPNSQFGRNPDSLLISNRDYLSFRDCRGCIDLHASARPACSSANTSGAARKSAHAPCRSFPTSVLLPARVTLEPRSKLDPPLDLPFSSFCGGCSVICDRSFRYRSEVSIEIEASTFPDGRTLVKSERTLSCRFFTVLLIRSSANFDPPNLIPSKCTGCCWKVCSISCRSVKFVNRTIGVLHARHSRIRFDRYLIFLVSPLLSLRT